MSSQNSMELDPEDKQEFEVKDVNAQQIKKDIEKLKITLILCHYQKNQKKCTELIYNFEIQELLNSNQDIILNKLVQKLKEIGFPIDGNMIYYYSPDAEMYVYCGLDPLPEDIVLDKFEYWSHKQVRIKSRDNPLSYIHQTMSEDANDLINRNKDQQPIKESNNANNGNQNTSNKSRRNNEKKIGFIIEKVVEWRRLYNGIKQPDGDTKKLSLDEAAKEVGIPKKSLDDYLLQIRFGRKYGYNFNEYKNEKVGQLRQFVRKNKQGQEKPKKKKAEKKDKIEN